MTADQLDMAPNAVDDQYTECRDKMLKKVVESGLLAEELNSNKEFEKAWNANKNCKSPIPRGVKEHTEALLTYVLGGKEFRKSFNNAVDTMGGNASVYDTNFQFKSLHFLLMDSMRLLKEKQCKTVYRITSRKYTVQQGSEVRFGRFTSTHSDTFELMEDPDLDEGILFNITSCSVLNLKENNCTKEGNIELLLSPAEVFKVEKVRRVKNEDYDYTEIILKHKRIHSNHDCYLFPR